MLGPRRFGPRRIGILGGGGGPLSEFAQVLGISNGLPFFTAGRYVETAGPGPGTFVVQSVRDWNDATHLAAFEGLAGNEPPLPTSNPAVFNGAPTLAFTGAQWFTSNRPAADWNFACDGVSCEKWNVFVLNDVANLQAVMSTRPGGGAGTLLYMWGGAQIADYLEGNAVIVINSAVGPAVPLGAQLYISSRYKAADPNQYELRQNGALGASGLYAAPTHTPSNGTFRLGALNAVGTWAAVMDWAATFFTPALDVAQRAVIDDWIAAGLPTP